MAFGMEYQQRPQMGYMGANAPRPAQPNVPAQGPAATSMPVPPSAGPQRPAFQAPNDNPQAAFNRPGGQASPNAAFNRPPMAAGPEGQYADNPRGQRPAAVNAMVGGPEQGAMQEQARQWVHNLMATNPQAFAELLRKRGLLQGVAGQPQPGGDMVAQPVPPSVQDLQGSLQGVAGPRPMYPGVPYGDSGFSGPRPIPQQPQSGPRPLPPQFNPWGQSPSLYELSVPFGGGQ